MVVSCPSMIFKRSFLSVSKDAVREATSFFRAVRILVFSLRSAASSAVRVSIVLWRFSILPDAMALPFNGLPVSSFANLVTASLSDLLPYGSAVCAAHVSPAPDVIQYLQALLISDDRSWKFLSARESIRVRRSSGMRKFIWVVVRAAFGRVIVYVFKMRQKQGVIWIVLFGKTMLLITVQSLIWHTDG